MPYRKIGIVKVPRSKYIPQFCNDILSAFGSTFDRDVADCILSLGNWREFLKDFWFDRILHLKHPVLDGNPELKFKMEVVLADFLSMTGYIKLCPVQWDYVTDPTWPADDLITLMLGTRMPTWTAADLGGQFGQLSTLSNFFQEVIRRNALVIHERPMMAERFRRWLGDIGFKLQHQRSGALSQAERSFLVVYSNTKKRSKGYIDVLPSTPIAPVENKEPLVHDVGALAVATCLAGPCTSHMKMVSNGILEQLVYYYGPHIPALKGYVGYYREYGPFKVFDVDPEDEIPWMLDSQLTGISAMAANIALKPGNIPPYTIRVPLPITYSNKSGKIAMYPDLPDINLYLTDLRDISRFTWDYMSRWRGRRINSLNDGGTMDYLIADWAQETTAGGGINIDMMDLSQLGLCWYTPALGGLIQVYDGKISESYVLPGPTGLVTRQVDMTAYYARFGKVEFLPPFAEFLQLPMSWFMTPADRVVDYIQSRESLTLLERIRFQQVISFCHNIARYERITRHPAPLNRDRMIRSLLNLPPWTSTAVSTPMIT